MSDAVHPLSADRQTRGARDPSSPVTALCVRAEPSEFEVDRRIRAERARVTWIETTIAATGAGSRVRSGGIGFGPSFSPWYLERDVPFLCRIAFKSKAVNGLINAHSDHRASEIWVSNHWDGGITWALPRPAPKPEKSL
jgi:hypothetical protein